jgi:predicted AAA+ superfamily ATPase
VGKERMTDRGHILENVVYLELIRRGNKVWTGTARNTEIDFVCKTPLGEIEYYQIAWQLATESTIEREFSALEKMKDKTLNTYYPSIHSHKTEAALST